MKVTILQGMPPEQLLNTIPSGGYALVEEVHNMKWLHNWKTRRETAYPGEKYAIQKRDETSAYVIRLD